MSAPQIVKNARRRFAFVLASIKVPSSVSKMIAKAKKRYRGRTLWWCLLVCRKRNEWRWLWWQGWKWKQPILLLFYYIIDLKFSKYERGREQGWFENSSCVIAVINLFISGVLCPSDIWRRDRFIIPLARTLPTIWSLRGQLSSTPFSRLLHPLQSDIKPKYAETGKWGSATSGINARSHMALKSSKLKSMSQIPIKLNPVSNSCKKCIVRMDLVASIFILVWQPHSLNSRITWLFN